MNYYKRHIGDYSAATRHLSILEHGVYMLLLDLYYTSEAPLNPRHKSKCVEKLAHAQKDECAVGGLLCLKCNFFTLHGMTGWHQSRCEAEIDIFRVKLETNRVTGRRGGRPNKETQTVNSENPEITQSVSVNTKHETLTTNHKPLTTNHKNTNTPPEGVSESVWADFCQHRKDKRSRITDTAIDGIRREAERAGWGLEAALRECCSRGWTGFKADWVMEKPKSAETFAERDARNGRKRWEEMTGQAHPDNLSKIFASSINADSLLLEVSP